MILNLLGHKYELDELDPGMWTGRGVGRSDVITGKISLLKNSTKDLKASTLLHEVIHQIGDLNDLGSFTENETLISVLAVGLLDFLRSNPEVVKTYLENS